MAKAIITREIEYLPANPAAKCKRLDITKIANIDISRNDSPGKTVILLKSGHKRYSSEDVLTISKAYHEAKGEGDERISESGSRDTSKTDGIHKEGRE